MYISYKRLFNGYTSIWKLLLTTNHRSSIITAVTADGPQLVCVSLRVFNRLDKVINSLGYNHYTEWLELLVQYDIWHKSYFILSVYYIPIFCYIFMAEPVWLPAESSCRIYAAESTACGSSDQNYSINLLAKLSSN